MCGLYFTIGLPSPQPEYTFSAFLMNIVELPFQKDEQIQIYNSQYIEHTL